MGTQGLVTITENGETVLKAVAGCNGFHAVELGGAIKDRNLESIEDIYEGAKEVGFGCDSCLVVLSQSNQITSCGEVLGERYRETFSDPKFNPRWCSGSVSHYVKIEKIPEGEREREAEP